MNGADDPSVAIFYQRLRELVAERRAREGGITEAVIARQLGLAPRRFNMYMNRKREVPLELVPRLCQYFGTRPDFLFGFSDEPAPPQRSTEDRLRLLEVELGKLNALLTRS